MSSTTYMAFDQVPFGVMIWEVPTDDISDICLSYANHQADLDSGCEITKWVGSTILEAFEKILPVPDEPCGVKMALLTSQDGIPRTIRDMPCGSQHPPERTYNIHISRYDDSHVLVVYQGNASKPEIKHLQKLEKKLLMLKNLPGVAIYTEFDGTVIDVNRLPVGYPLDVQSFIGTNLFEYYTSELNTAMVKAVNMLVENGLQTHTYISGRSSHGHQYKVTVKRVRLPGNGVVLLWVMWDITQQMVTQDKLKLANEDLEQFAYIVSHDLQEPIRTISTFAELLIEEYPELFSGEEPKEFMSYIRDSAFRQQRLIRDVLAYSRTSDMVFEECNVFKSFNNVRNSLTSLIHRRNAIVDWTGVTDTQVTAAVTYLEMALQNLISNAIKYTPEDRVPVVRVSLEEKGNYWILHVHDNGIGIKDVYADQVFRMFKRLHPEMLDIEGTGIGLPVCRRIARKHGGDCWFTSHGKNDGTTFHLSIRKPIKHS